MILLGRPLLGHHVTTHLNAPDQQTAKTSVFEASHLLVITQVQVISSTWLLLRVLEKRESSWCRGLYVSKWSLVRVQLKAKNRRGRSSQPQHYGPFLLAKRRTTIPATAGLVLLPLWMGLTTECILNTHSLFNGTQQVLLLDIFQLHLTIMIWPQSE